MSRRPKQRGDSWIAVVLRLLVAGLAGAAATWQAATFSGIIAAGAGAMVGVLLGEIVGRSRARFTTVTLVGGLFFILGVLGWSLLTRWVAVATAVGPGSLITFADAVMLACFAVAFCLVLRVFGARYRVMAGFELAFMAAALASPLSAHRGGSINRPLPLADYAWSQGEDPLIYLQAAGGIAAVSLVLFLVAERRWVRALVAAILVLVASVAIGYFATMIQPPQIGLDRGLGMMGRGSEEGEGGSKGPRSLDQLDFRDNYDSKRRNAPVAVVLLHDDYEPRDGAYYFRQSAFSRYNGRRMVPALDVGVDRDVFQFFPAVRRQADWIPPMEHRVLVETTMALLRDHVNPVVLEAPETVSPAKNPSPRRFRRAYKATSLALDLGLSQMLGKAVGDPSWSKQQRELYLEAPTDPRYRELVDRVILELRPELRDDPVARALIIADDLSRRGTYSLRSRHASASDPTASFLFGDMTGYCVHFAHAAVYLFRTAGVPTRLATGYQYPANQRGRGSSLLIRSGDAHAWPEIYVDGVGWVVVDITPVRNLEEPGTPLDPELQRMLGEMLRGQLEDQRRATMAIGDSPQFFASFLSLVKQGLYALVGLLALFVVMLYLIKIYRRFAMFIASPAQRTRLAYRWALDLLSEVGQRRRRGESPEHFAERVEALVPSLQPLCASASARALGSRKKDEPLESVRLARSVKAEIRRVFPWWRRTLGMLDPHTWLSVH